MPCVDPRYFSYNSYILILMISSMNTILYVISILYINDNTGEIIISTYYNMVIWQGRIQDFRKGGGGVVGLTVKY